MSRQDQKVEQGSKAYQAGGNLTIIEGMSADQMASIMLAMSGQLSNYFAEAQGAAEQRFEELRTSILEEVAKAETKFKTEAFRDPDYQFVLKSAHQGYARTGGQYLKEELVKLLAERSSRTTGSRISMILNEAISIAPVLTREEYAALALTFSFKNVMFGSTSLVDICNKIDSVISAFYKDMPRSKSSFEYLSSMRCAIVNEVFSVDIMSAIKQSYGFRFSDGFSVPELNEALMGPESLSPLTGILAGVDEKVDGRHSLFSLKFENEDKLKKSLTEGGFSSEAVAALISLDNSRRMTEDKIGATLESAVPNFADFRDVWESTSFKSCDLTGLGKAIAHSALVSRLEFPTPLEVWVN